MAIVSEFAVVQVYCRHSGVAPCREATIDMNSMIEDTVAEALGWLQTDGNDAQPAEILTCQMCGKTSQALWGGST